MFFSRRSSALAVSLFSLFAALPAARAREQLPSFDGYVVDQAGILDAASRAQLTQIASRLDHAGIAQLAVCTVADLGEQSIEEFAVDLFKKWGLGHDKKRSDGVLLVLVPKPGGHAKVRTEVGYGLEGVLPDGRVGAIQREQMGPLVRQSRYGAAAVAWMTTVAGILESDAGKGGDAAPTADSPRGGRGIGRDGGDDTGTLGLVIVALGALLVSQMVAASRRTFPGKVHGLSALAALAAAAVAFVVIGYGVRSVVALVIGAVVNLLSWLSIRSHRCPRCQQWMTIDNVTLDEPTYYSSGIAEVTEDCTNCSYVNRYRKILPRLERSSSSSSGGGGGGDSGGGFSGGGGGESGGGGASSDL